MWAPEARFIPAEREKGSLRGMNAPTASVRNCILQAASCSGRAWNKNAKKKGSERPPRCSLSICLLTTPVSDLVKAHFRARNSFVESVAWPASFLQGCRLSNDIGRSKSRLPLLNATWGPCWKLLQNVTPHKVSFTKIWCGTAGIGKGVEDASVQSDVTGGCLSMVAAGLGLTPVRLGPIHE